jgi:hypothetical protein
MGFGQRVLKSRQLIAANWSSGRDFNEKHHGLHQLVMLVLVLRAKMFARYFLALAMLLSISIIVSQRPK